MERFVCGVGVQSKHNQPEPALLEQMGITDPEQLHLSVDTVCAMARGMERAGWLPLPFCNTLCSEGLGAKPVLTLEGARVKEPPFACADQLPNRFASDGARLTVMLSAMDRLCAEGKQIAYSVEGPFTVISSLIPMNRMFALLRKPAGAELLARAEDWICDYAKLAVAHGAKVLSFADPVATVDILGEKCFTGIYLPACRSLLARLQAENPGTVLHLCGKLTQSLLDTSACRVSHWVPEQECETYGQALSAYCAQPGTKGLVGHFCLNLLNAKRPRLSELILE